MSIREAITRTITLAGLKPEGVSGNGVVNGTTKYSLDTYYDAQGAKLYQMKLEATTDTSETSSVLINGTFNPRTGELKGNPMPGTGQVAVLLGQVALGVDELTKPMREAQRVIRSSEPS